ncbi:MAG: F0F1 ATP synthase subunit B [Clostridiales bacterium]|nr:F0F1 ATP synthase subunit B [Clostridiales bacterium]
MLRLDWNLLFTMIDLVIFYFLLKKFLFKPVNAIMQKRQDELNEKFSQVADMEKEAKELKNKYESDLRKLEEEKAKIIFDAKTTARNEYARIIKSADKRAEDIVTEAQKIADAEKQRTLQSMEADITGLAVAAAAKILGDKTTSSSNKALYDEFLTRAGETK